MGGGGRIHLRRGSLALDLLPACGGAVTRFAGIRGERTVELFRPAPATLPERLPVLATSCFPLVPFSGRIRDARLSFAGRTYDLPRAPTGEANALHGEGWLVPWRVERATESEASLSYRGVGLGWPFAYSAGQRFDLREDRLIAEIWIENDGRHPMPAGIGLHPWFIATPEARLTMRAERVWLVDAANLFDRTAPVPERWDFSAGRRLAGTNLVNGFSGWDGRATIEWPEWNARLMMTADAALRHLVVYTPPGEGFFCVEPVSHSVDAFNLAEAGVPDTGAVILNPGETLRGRVEFLPEF